MFDILTPPILLPQNACGLKPYDVAAQTGHHACAEYLLTFETLSDLAGDFCSLEAEAARLSRHNADYKDNFRSVAGADPGEAEGALGSCSPKALRVSLVFPKRKIS